VGGISSLWPLIGLTLFGTEKSASDSIFDAPYERH
jgi:hypothetical protein